MERTAAMTAGPLLVVGLTALTAVLGCSDDPGASGADTAPLPTAATVPRTSERVTSTDVTTDVAAGVTTSTSPPTTAGPTSSVPAETVLGTPPTTTPAEALDAALDTWPAELGTPVASVPGVASAGQIRELRPGLWLLLPTAPDPADPHVQPPLPEDIPIIAAYAETQTAIADQLAASPVAATPSPRLAASLLYGGARYAANVLQPWAERGTYLDYSDGVVLRPRVIADPRSDDEAFIFDCQLDGSVIRTADGALAEGQVPGVTTYPQISRLQRVDGRWIADRINSDDRVCA